ncbi:MAG: hypothetical protein IKF79_02685 [Methanosphaera sp.]|nr:hypothetical protein [Methanosphaera sp.]
MRTDVSGCDEELYELIDENNFNLYCKECYRQAKNTQKQSQTNVKLEKCQEMIEETIQRSKLFRLEARKNSNKKGVTLTGYNEQIIVNNKSD